MCSFLIFLLYMLRLVKNRLLAVNPVIRPGIDLGFSARKSIVIINSKKIYIYIRRNMIPLDEYISRN